MNQATHKQSLLNETAGLRPPPMFHAAQPTGYVPMYNTPQVCHHRNICIHMQITLFI